MAANDALTIAQNVLGVTQTQTQNLASPATAIPTSRLVGPFLASKVMDGDTTLSPEVLYEYGAVLNLAAYTYRI